MSIASAITSLQSRVASAYTAVSNKGGTLPQVQNTTNLPTAIASIPQSGGSSTKFGATIDQVFNTTTSGQDTELTMYGGCTDLTFTGVTTVGNQGLQYAFYKSGMTGAVSFPDLTSVGEYGLGYAFRQSKLSSVSFPDLTTVGVHAFEYAFQECTRLTSFSFASLTGTVQANYLFDHAFTSSGITSVSFPNVTTIGNSSSIGVFSSAFNGCTSLTSISFPELVTIYGGGNPGNFNNAFTGCTSLTTVSFPKLTTATSGYGASSGYGAFYEAFSGCTSLTTVSFPELTTAQGISSGTNVRMGSFNGTFKNCTSLTSVSFTKMTSISGTSAFENAFNGCTLLTSLSFPAVETISGLTVFKNAIASTNGTTLSFPALTSVTSNASAAGNAIFYGCATLTRVDFPVLTSIKKSSSATTDNLTYLFNGCTNLTEIHFGQANQSVIEASDGYATKWGAPNANCQVYFDLT